MCQLDDFRGFPSNSLVTSFLRPIIIAKLRITQMVDKLFPSIFPITMQVSEDPGFSSRA